MNNEDIDKNFENNAQSFLLDDEILAEIEYNVVSIKTDFIKLDQFLKHVDIAPTGGMAKHLILDGLVYVNGEACFMRGKKLYKDDKVIYADVDEESENARLYGYLILNK